MNIETEYQANGLLPVDDRPSAFMEEISDSRLATMLQKHLNKHYKHDKTLTGIRLCSSQSVPVPGVKQGVYLISNGQGSKFFGLNTCHSSWACPRCTAKVMTEYGVRIGCAIEALKRWHNQVAFMITFTLPHTKAMPCKLAFDTLHETWRKFSKAGNHAGTLRHDRGKSSYRGAKVYGRMREELGIKHFVRVFEFTWSELNGWHPHIHALFWIDKNKLQEPLKYKNDLLDEWWKAARLTMLDRLNKSNPDDKVNNEIYVNKLYADWRKYPSGGPHRSVWISVDGNGRVREEKSSTYISGWGGDFELTGGQRKFRKQAKDGHYTPHQLLQLAYSDPIKKVKYIELYIEYARATRGKKRFHFSARSGITKIIEKWRLSNAYEKYLKKKVTDKETKPYRVIAWFSNEQWFNIYHLELKNTDILNRMLIYALFPCGKQLIEQLLLHYDIDIRNNTVSDYTKQAIEEIYLKKSA